MMNTVDFGSPTQTPKKKDESNTSAAVVTQSQSLDEADENSIASLLKSSPSSGE